jgi:hypothetical protein
MAKAKKRKKAWVYDVETPSNFFCLSAIELSGDKIIQFIIDDDTGRNDREEIMKFFTDIYAIGYNNQRFDDLIVNFIIATPHVTANLCHELGKIIIETQRLEDGDTTFYQRFKKWTKSSRYASVDLLRLHFSKKLRVGLKEMECSLNHDNVEELPYHHSRILSAEEKEKTLSYNVNDIRATKLVAQNSQEAFKIRQWAWLNYGTGIRGFSMDGVTLGMEVFSKMLQAKINSAEFLHHRTVRKTIHIGDILTPCLSFKTPEFQSVLARYQNLVVFDRDYSEYIKSYEGEDEEESAKEKEVVKKFKWSPAIKGHKFKYGLGGLHKDVLSGVWKTTDTHRVVSVDVVSYYPRIIIQWKFKPRHLPEQIYEVYQSIMDQRVAAKKAGDKLKDETLKLSVNGFFGNTNNPYSWAYDLQTTLATTINGQLMLSMLCEDFLVEKDFILIDVNTDGIYLRYPKEKHERYQQIISQWEEKTRMRLEETEFNQIYFLTTADYFGIDVKGKEKAKGLFIDKVRLGKGMEFNIIAKAVKSYFLDGRDFREFIKSHDKILDFCAYKKLNAKYTCYWKGERQQRINRFYASRAGASLFKEKKVENKKKSTQVENILKDSPVMLLNRLEERPISEYQINYGFYNKRAEKIIIAIEGIRQQTSLIAA